MANVNLALDEIISTQKKRRGGGPKIRGNRKGVVGRAGRGKRRGGDFGREKYFSEDVPSGKWKHDKFFDVYGKKGNKKIGGNISIRGGRRIARNAASKIVKLNLSNLPETVVTADLEELFQDFDVYGVTVHYDETGAHLGTADLFTSTMSAKDILREYANIAIDSQEIKIGVVDESGELRPKINERIRRIGGKLLRRKNGLRSNIRRSNNGRIAKPRRTLNSSPKLKKMTVEELDKELEAYMGGRHGKE